ncbi:Bifunctional P-450:NADPH-P450 reductase [Neonectria ditissima]|uniref:Bifunctional cytochrome P450/NADPH--P450 reductase n=1 Tax=Neonectria ditissima TaxID=78410 RepID=A0A0P7AK17_9HYPO|nr:Bifunctional P-450:NADPH-P450 reductase [Neonectria ditissima]
MPSKIPGPRGLPLLGNIADIDPSDAVASLGRIAETYGPIYKLNLVGSEKLFISSRELMDEVSDEKRFTKLVSGPLFQLRNAVGDSLFTAHSNEPNWDVAHRVLMPAMGPLAIRGMFDEMHDVATQLLTKWARFGPKETIDVTSDFTRLTLDTIALCSMGTRFNSFYHEEMHPFVGSMIGLLEESGKRAPRPNWVNYLMPASQAKYEADIHTLQQVGANLLADRRVNPTDKKDILNALINGIDPKTGKGMSDESILNNMIVFLIAGHETTSGLLSFLFYYLLKKADVFEKAQKEVDEVVGRGPVTIEHLSELPYLEACLREVLRLHPTAPVITLQPRPDLVQENLTIGKAEYAVGPGQPIVALLTQVHRDPAVWGPDANEFRAERMSDENFSRLPKNSWKPFGNGIRGCIGRAFAWQESLLVTVMLLQTFNFRLKDPEYELKIKQTLTIKPGDFYMHATLRDHLDSVQLGKSLYGNSQPSNGHSKQSEVETKPTATPHASKKMTILYGSDSGTCETMAQALARAAPTRGYDATLSSLDAAVDDLPREQPVILICSSYNGHPPNNAAGFVAWLEGLKSDNHVLKGITFAVYGCGNRDYGPTFHRIPKLLDSELGNNGATRLMDIGLGDVTVGDIFSDFEAWQDDRLWPALGAYAVGNVDGAFDIKIDRSYRPSDLREDFNEAVVLTNSVVTAPSEPEKRTMTLKLPDAVKYTAGDHIAVLPLNDSDTVRRVLRWAKLPWDAVITIPTGSNTTLPTGRAISAPDLLSGYVELSRPATRKVIPPNVATITARAADEKTRNKMLALEEDFDNSVTLQRRSVLDILEDTPEISLPFAEFLAMLPPMRARKYSVASSPLADASTVTLLWSVVDKESPLNPVMRRRGVASTYLARLNQGDSIHVAVKPALRLFHPPTDVENTPVIMACAGTGLAPFRAFVQERSVHAQAGRNLAPAYLFIGCRDPSKDTLLQEELRQWEKLDIVKVFYAFSQASEQSSGCKYVQDRIWKEREIVERVIVNGKGIIYVCGGAGVGKGVEEVMKRIYSLETRANTAEQWVQDLKSSRYAREIFS